MAKKQSNLKYYEAIGRRKSSIARVRLYLTGEKEIKGTDKKMKKGDIIINNMPVADYFPGDTSKALYLRPLKLVGAEGRFAVSIMARGGGKQGQMEASILGMARALEEVDSENRAILKPEGLLSRDGRVRERRKPGTGGRARRQKQSPKR